MHQVTVVAEGDVEEIGDVLQIIHYHVQVKGGKIIPGGTRRVGSEDEAEHGDEGGDRVQVPQREGKVKEADDGQVAVRDELTADELVPVAHREGEAGALYGVEARETGDRGARGTRDEETLGGGEGVGFPWASFTCYGEEERNHVIRLDGPAMGFNESRPLKHGGDAGEVSGRRDERFEAARRPRGGGHGGALIAGGRGGVTGMKDEQVREEGVIPDGLGHEGGAVEGLR